MMRFLSRIILAIAPKLSREWIAAMLTEADHVPNGDRVAWHAGAVRLALAARVRHWSFPLSGGALALAMLAVDWTSGALLPALALIALSAAVLTRGPKNEGGALVVAAGTLPVAHAIANWMPILRPHYQYASLDRWDWAILAAVAGIGCCAVRIATAFWKVRGFA